MDCGASFPRPVAAVKEQDPFVNGLRCPACDVPMHSGRAAVTVPWQWEALLAKLIFRRSGRHDWRVVMNYRMRSAARCPRCEGVWITPAIVR